MRRGRLIGAATGLLSVTCALAACGGGREHAGAGSVLDCRFFGRVVHTADPANDVRPNNAAGTTAAHPDIDLLDVAVARRGDKLCVDFTTKSPPRPDSVLQLTLRKKECSQSGPLEDVMVIFDSGRPQVMVKPVENENLDNGIREADVRQSGDRTSVVIRRGQMPPYAPFDDFMWQAEGVSTETQPAQYSDVAPDSADLLYPEGTAGGGLQGCHQTPYGVRCAPLPAGC